MSRIRTIKPQMFKDADLGELGFAARWMFVGLLTLADREGRLEDKPREIGVEVIPFDMMRGKIEPDVLLSELSTGHFITRYRVDGKSYIQVDNFLKHQRPNTRESESVIPAPHRQKRASTCRNVQARAETFEASACTLGREGKGREVNTLHQQKAVDGVVDGDFEEFWRNYPRKVGKGSSRKAWFKTKKNRPPLPDLLKALSSQKLSPDWQKDDGQFIPHPTTWLNQERWSDEVKGVDNELYA